MEASDNVPPTRWSLEVAAVAGALGVAAGAFGAHGIEHFATDDRAIAWWQTAAQYHLVHAVALLVVVVALPRARMTALAWIAGLVLFCGSLYAMALGGPELLRKVTPLGGVALIGGWVALWPRRARSREAKRRTE